MKLYLVPALATLLAAGTSVPVLADETTAYRTLMGRAAPTIVTVRTIVKMQMGAGGQGADQETRMEVQGAVVDRSGLIMVTNSAFDPGSLLGLPEASGLGFKFKPVSFKVLFPGDEKEYDAFQAATDTKLNLAFLQVEGLSGRSLTAVEFHGATAPQLGDTLVAVSRLPRGFDYAPYFQSGHVSCAIEKPRLAWMLDGAVSALGLPVYSANGTVVGVLSTIASGVKEDGDDMGMGIGMMMRMFSGGGGALHTFVLPAASVEPTIALAKARAVQVGAERAQHKPPAPATPAAPAVHAAPAQK